MERWVIMLRNLHYIYSNQIDITFKLEDQQKQKKFWTILKRKFTNKLYKTLEEVRGFITEATNSFYYGKIKTSCGFGYIFAG